MCRYCDSGQPSDHARSHLFSWRDFVKAAAVVGAAVAAAPALFDAPPARAQASAAPADAGTVGRRYIIRGGAVLSMDLLVGASGIFERESPI